MATIPPTMSQFVQTASWNTAGTSKSTSAALSIKAGDTLVAVATAGDASTPGTIGTPTGGTGLTWTAVKTDASTTTQMGTWTWTTTSATTQSVTFTCTQSTSTAAWGFGVYAFTGSAGIGASVITHVTTAAAPTLSMTTTGDHSTIVVLDSDWSAIAGTPAWRTNFGAITQLTNDFVTGSQGVYGGYHADAGTVSTAAIGMTAPSQKYTIVGIEVLGSTLVAEPRIPGNWTARMRAANW